MNDLNTTRMLSCIERYQGGDALALNELLDHFESRLVALTHKMLRRFPEVQRWEQTDDVFQQAVVRLISTLRVVEPSSVSHLFALAVLQIKRALLDLAEKYRSRVGPSAGDEGDQVTCPSSQEPSRLAAWTEFHEKVAQLPDQLREVFELIFYGGLTHGDVARVLGVGEDTIGKRWRHARRALLALYGGEMPDL